MISLKHLRRTVFAVPRLIGPAGLLVVVLVCAASLPAQAATRARGGRSDTITIEPTPLFDEDELSRLIEKPSITFSADPARIPKGGSAKLTWRVENADSVRISSIGNVPTHGTRSVSPQNKTTYTLTATGRNTTLSKSVTVDVTELAAVIGTVKIVTPVLMLENIVFDFVAMASKANWSGKGKLQFGGSSGTKGWVRMIQNVRAEDNKNYTKVLQMQPEIKPNGCIVGEYGVKKLPAKARFAATVGFTANHGSRDGATVFVYVFGTRAGSRTPTNVPVAVQKISRDGKLDTIAADLAMYAGQTVVIRLLVHGGKDARDDIVLWIAPRIIR